MYAYLFRKVTYGDYGRSQWPINTAVIFVYYRRISIIHQHCSPEVEAVKIDHSIGDALPIQSLGYEHKDLFWI